MSSGCLVGRVLFLSSACFPSSGYGLYETLNDCSEPVTRREGHTPDALVLIGDETFLEPGVRNTTI